MELIISIVTICLLVSIILFQFFQIQKHKIIIRNYRNASNIFNIRSNDNLISKSKKELIEIIEIKDYKILCCKERIDWNDEIIKYLKKRLSKHEDTGDRWAKEMFGI